MYVPGGQWSKEQYQQNKGQNKKRRKHKNIGKEMTHGKFYTQFVVLFLFLTGWVTYILMEGFKLGQDSLMVLVIIVFGLGQLHFSNKRKNFLSMDSFLRASVGVVVLSVASALIIKEILKYYGI